ncbi:hypothetical protein BK648_11190 [Pseudomonas poae]|uniref:Uncharacterized protein n=1 Tax=Pseudomonas poae TaxID=200451 RepID=A0A423F514_9PSED|nr:hypothetical protein BK648_11190 [Pseudomonas poae]
MPCFGRFDAIGSKPDGQSVETFCRSELAREKLTGAASTQATRVIVDVFSRASSLLQDDSDTI